MQQMKDMIENNISDRERLGLVINTLAHLGRPDENLAEVAHDARNMVTALGLYCDLLKEPGVLADSFRHYASELQLVATASRRLVDKLATLDAQLVSQALAQADVPLRRVPVQAGTPGGRPKLLALAPPQPIEDLAAQVLALRNLLAALAGPAIEVVIAVEGGAQPVRLTGEDLTRILVNLVKNAAEAMPKGGRIQIDLHETQAAPGDISWMMLTVEDNGPGIAHRALGCIFESGVSTHNPGRAQSDRGQSPVQRGLGLAITRSIVEAAGGRIHAANRDPWGACFQIELPVRHV